MNKLKKSTILSKNIILQRDRKKAEQMKIHKEYNSLEAIHKFNAISVKW
jgi:hypothetical protein